jgi:hypothetical protein
MASTTLNRTVFVGVVLAALSLTGACRGRAASEAEMARLAEATRSSAEESGSAASEEQAEAEEASAAAPEETEVAAAAAEGSDEAAAANAVRTMSMEGSALPGQGLRPRLQNRLRVGGDGPRRMSPELRQRMIQRRTELRGGASGQPGSGVQPNLQFRGSTENGDPTTGQGARYNVRARQAREL